MFARMVVCLIIGVFLLSCERTVEEDLKVTLSYSHPKQQEYPEANYRYYSQRPVLVHKHYIDVKVFYSETSIRLYHFG